MTRPEGDRPDREQEGAVRYRTQLDPSNLDQSQVALLGLVGRGTKVLEVGPSTGYMTRLLRQQGCMVTGVEIDPEAAREAEAFCERMIVADIEQLDFGKEFQTDRFDVVIYGDVLEHLVDPVQVLVNTRRVLAPNGYVVASIPNIVHGSVRLSLLAGTFRYTELGLLDRTHLRFFDRHGVQSLFREAGYVISRWGATKADLFDTEIDLRGVSFPDYLLEAIRAEADALVYQFIVRADPQAASVGAASDDLPHETRNLAPLRDVERELSELRSRLSQAEDRLHSLKHTLNAPEHKAASRLRSLLERTMPWGTRRRTFVLAPVRAVRLLREEGWRALLAHLVKVWRWFPGLFRRSTPLPGGLSSDERYGIWLQAAVFSADGLRRARHAHREFSYRPKVSVVMPVSDPEQERLDAAVSSIVAQMCPEWELWIVDTGSRDPDSREILRSIESSDPRIRVHWFATDQGVASAWNEGLTRVTGEYVCFLDHDCELKEIAFLEVVRLLNANRDLDVVYSDEDRRASDGKLSDPFFKPGWSPDLLMSMDYITRFSVCRRDVVEEVGGLRAGYEGGAQQYDLILRVTERTDRIARIPLPLCTRWKIPGAPAGDGAPDAFEAGRRAIQDALERRGLRATVEEGLVRGLYRVRYEIDGDPTVRIIIPTRDKVDLLRRCVDSVRERTGYSNYEITIVDNQSEEPSTLEFLRTFPGEVIPYPHPFNYARMMNEAAARVDDDLILFLNNDIEVINSDWLQAMVEHAERPEVAAVGARLFYPGGGPQHEGIVVGPGRGLASNMNLRGYFALGEAVRNSSAVTAACMMMRPEVFRELGGFDENLEVAYNDVDLCLRAREKGYLIVYTPYARLIHLEGGTRGRRHPRKDNELFRARWRGFEDPYWNPNQDFADPFAARLG